MERFIYLFIFTTQILFPLLFPGKSFRDGEERRRGRAAAEVHAEGNPHHGGRDGEPGAGDGCPAEPLHLHQRGEHVAPGQHQGAGGGSGGGSGRIRRLPKQDADSQGGYGSGGLPDAGVQGAGGEQGTGQEVDPAAGGAEGKPGQRKHGAEGEGGERRAKHYLPG